MELLATMIRLSTGAELVGAVLTGRTTRVVLLAAAIAVGLMLPDMCDPALAVVEIVVIRRLG